ncbi:NAD-glutamate dehydrogenase domain-containing protein [Kribbella sp. NPDC050820]|uniref:NAD-glutamate dehydrogenase domain-containing protein n=1 Tax=Kribbella sp. NPDC050820 TaxID=3155408 RepID=UPI0033CA0417
MATSSLRGWQGGLQEALAARLGQARAIATMGRYARAFPEGFHITHPPAIASAWVAALEEYAGVREPLLRLVVPDQLAAEQLDLDLDDGTRLLLLWPSPAPALLADVFPVLENLALRIAGHEAYEVRPAGRAPVRVEEFRLLPREVAVLKADPALRNEVADAFGSVWSGHTENDAFNQLVLRAGLSWREVSALRAAFAYLRQAGLAFSQGYVERTLLTHRRVTRLLVALFHARLDPAYDGIAREEEALADMEAALAIVENLSEDRLLRSFVELVCAVLRTNYYQPDANGVPKPYLVLKLDSTALSFLPVPRPMTETFVYSTRMEGLHLRTAKVARGGLRWSDRTEDYRTEVLSLMKAQRVKNAVIVPHGAKGAFVVKRPPAATDAETMRQAVRTAYETFVRGLLDVTDNRVDGTVAQPPRVRCRDDADAYLVVAADKGTATMSDLANEIAREYGFWLGDAFASGGATGYDHKALGVTARGAWESVRRHFGELGLDPAKDQITVVGIGDMSGDVFGNGMLLSDRIRLVAAFDHRHVFLDPDPDPAASYAERQRLSRLPGSSWADYEPRLISSGGGVFSRMAKSVPLSPQARALLDVQAEQLPADELIRAVLRTQADLLFNGGVGTYVKASTESHADVGDRANDAVRVDASELRTRVVVEGGNLGVTQRGRVEYSLAGGLINTDFIDNSAGVDISDREVNLKILLDAAVKGRRLSRSRRDELLRQVAPQIVEQVLANNAAQARAISVSHALGAGWLDKQTEMIRHAEDLGFLERALESLPDEEAVAQRQAGGLGLTRPEIAVLLAVSKDVATHFLLESGVPDDAYIGSAALARYLPPALRAEFNDLLPRHPLHREIACSVLANEAFNRMGSGALLRVQELTGRDREDLVVSYVAARDVFALPAVWTEIDRLDVARHANLQTRLLGETRHVVESAARWFMRHGHAVDPAIEVARLRPGIDKLSGCLDQLMPPLPRRRLDSRIADLVAEGAPPELARAVCLLEPLTLTLGVVEATEATGADLTFLTSIFTLVGEQLQIDWLREQAAERPTDDHWSILARVAFGDDLVVEQQHMALAILHEVDTAPSPEQAVAAWLQHRPRRLALLDHTLQQLRGAADVGVPMLAVALEGLRSLQGADPGPGARLT